MYETKSGKLRVPGASLYYQVRGSGPLLLMVPAGAGDADSYKRLVVYLDDHFTVVTYDRRGYARSPLDDPDQPVKIATHSNDLHCLLSALSSKPAYVFGCSIGALIGLDLAIRHPEQVGVLVAHEPPVGAMLPREERESENLSRMYQRRGAAIALQEFATRIGVQHDGPGKDIGLPRTDSQAADANREAFFRYDVGAVARYKLNLKALKSSPTPVVLAGGSAGRQYFPYRCAAALSRELGTEIMEFPGDHAGWVDHPREFADRLRQIYFLQDRV